jgi:xanthine dehydrogenase large subunit
MQSATAFRGFGGPQGMLATEQVLDEIARHLGMDALDVRRRNFYQPDAGDGVRDVTHYGQKLEDFIMPALFDALEQSSDYRARRQQINAWNASQPVIRRGLAITPVKFGISFTSTMLNQAGALVNVYTDGTVLLNHGGTEMGQGLFTKVAQIVAEVFAIDLSRVRSTASDTARVPNASATAASSGADLNGKAAQAAALEIRNRMRDFAASHFSVDLADVRFAGNSVQAGAQQLSFAALAKLCWMHRVSLSATGYYRTPKIAYDAQTLRGRPFFYFADGAAVAVVAAFLLRRQAAAQADDHPAVAVAVAFL